MKIYPLGSECYLNAGLGESKIQSLKMFKSPFNGTRILSNAGINPIILFLEDRKTFMKLYSEQSNWRLHHGVDLNGYNEKLNIRRCHLKENDPFSFIPQCNNSVENLNNEKEVMYMVDMNDYIPFSEQRLKEMKVTLEKFNYRCFLRPLNIYDSLLTVKQEDIKSNYNLENQISMLRRIFNIHDITYFRDGIQAYKEYFNKDFK